MTTWKGFDQKLTKFQRAVTGHELRGITTRVAGKAKPILTAGITPDTLSHWGRGAKRGGYHAKARYDIKSDSVARMSATPKPLVALLEKGSGTTWKSPKRKGSKRRQKGSVGTYTRTKVPARKSFTHGEDVLRPRVGALVHQEVERVLRGIF